MGITGQEANLKQIKVLAGAAAVVGVLMGLAVLLGGLRG